MSQSRKMWTGIALLAAVLTVAEVAAVASAARGAQRWWSGDQGRAIRRAGTIVEGMIADRLGAHPGFHAGSWAAGVSDLHQTLEGIAATGGCPGTCVVVRREWHGSPGDVVAARLLAREQAQTARMIAWEDERAARALAQDRVQAARMLARERVRAALQRLERMAL